MEFRLVLFRSFAGSIVMGKADREIVLESLGCFNDVASLATAIGLPEEMVGEQFAAYDRMADAARTEARSEELRVGKECVSRGSSRWCPSHYHKREHYTTTHTPYTHRQPK